MKNLFVLFFTFILGIFMVSCSGGESENNNNTEVATNTEAAAAPAKPDKGKIAVPEGQSAEDFVFEKLKKGLKKRSIELSADQETALRQLISENDLTADNLKIKRGEILQKVQVEILTEEQKTSMKK